MIGKCKVVFAKGRELPIWGSTRAIWYILDSPTPSPSLHTCREVLPLLGFSLQCHSDRLALKDQSRSYVSNVTSADVRLATALGTATSLVSITNSV